MRDGRPNPRLSDMQRGVAASHRPLVDGLGQRAGHRPGFAFVNDAATREARARMYALKDVEYENAWRGYDDHPSSETDKQSDKAANHAEIFLGDSKEGQNK